jgi:hypothetical protein
MATVTQKASRLGKRKMEGRLGGPPETWAGNCHGASMAVVDELGEDVAVVRRGYFTGHCHPFSYFGRKGGVGQHSWVELRDGSVLDPTRFAITVEDPEWPVWHGPAGEYDIGGCRSQAPAGDPPSVFDSEHEPIELVCGSAEHLAVHLLGLPSEYYGEDWMQVSPEQVAWLAHLPIREGREDPGTISPFFAPELYEAIINAEQGALIPIDRRDWMLPEHSDGRAAF